MSDQLTPEQKAASEAEAAKKAASEAEAAKKAASEAEAALPSPPKGADYDTLANMHQSLLREGKPGLAEFFHKKHIVGFKASK